MSCQRYKCVVRITVIYGPAIPSRRRGHKNYGNLYQNKWDERMNGWMAKNCEHKSGGDSSRWAIRRSNKVIECIIRNILMWWRRTHVPSPDLRAHDLYEGLYFLKLYIPQETLYWWSWEALLRSCCRLIFATEAQVVKVEILLLRGHHLNSLNWCRFLGGSWYFLFYVFPSIKLLWTTSRASHSHPSLRNYSIAK